MVDQQLLITANTSSIGSSSELIDVQKDGENIQPISFNVRLILDVIKNTAEDNMVITLSGPLKPGVIRPKDSKDFTYVVMPMRTADTK
jgi:DNA polymerase-3 subunit beta